ncbi:hypothetical protein RUM44_007700 [Polyplax serrata]|uniref:Uncharacterized protein n=1 Tax=Polyplax serrata TaxID=468196 RepID=A0ABR1BAB3_POLSC
MKPKINDRSIGTGMNSMSITGDVVTVGPAHHVLLGIGTCQLVKSSENKMQRKLLFLVVLVVVQIQMVEPCFDTQSWQNLLTAWQNFFQALFSWKLPNSAQNATTMAPAATPATTATPAPAAPANNSNS